jgi:hypothetical protein
MEPVMHRGKGCKRSHPDKLAKRLNAAEHPAIAEKLASSLPASASLQQFEPPREDQGQTSSCTAHAASAGLTTAFAAIGKPLGFVPSPRAIYGVTRAIERSLATPEGAEPVLSDGGAELADVMSAIAQFGICPMATIPPDGRISDVTSDNVNLEPDLVQLTDAGTRLVIGVYGVDPRQHDVCAAAIADGKPLYVAFYADKGFENWVPSQAPYGAPIEAEPPPPGEGGHCVVIDAYTSNADGSRTWEVNNSWGSLIGLDGRWRVSDAFLSACWEVHILDVHLAPAPAAVAAKLPPPPKVPSDNPPKTYYVPEKLPATPPKAPPASAHPDILPSRYSSQPPTKSRVSSRPPKKDE